MASTFSTFFPFFLHSPRLDNVRSVFKHCLSSSVKLGSLWNEDKKLWTWKVEHVLLPWEQAFEVLLSFGLECLVIRWTPGVEDVELSHPFVQRKDPETEINFLEISWKFRIEFQRDFRSYQQHIRDVIKHFLSVQIGGTLLKFVVRTPHTQFCEMQSIFEHSNDIRTRDDKIHQESNEHRLDDGNNRRM